MQATAPSRFFIERLYCVCDKCNGVAPTGCRKVFEKLLAGLKPSVGHLQIFEGKILARVPDKTHKALDASARHSGLLQWQS